MGGFVAADEGQRNIRKIDFAGVDQGEIDRCVLVSIVVVAVFFEVELVL